MRIAIGIPAYNQGQYLAETLDSLLNQTVPPAEIVVSDNHSTDETPDILRRYEGRVRIIRPPEHLPVAAHFNFVVESLRGDWFSLLSSDDVAEPGFIQHLSRAVTLDRNAVLVRGGWLTISLSGQPTGRCLLLSTSTVTGPPRNFLEQLLGPKVSFAGFLCRRSAWAEVGGFPTSLGLYCDWGFWLRLSGAGTFVTIHKVVARYRTGYPDRTLASRIVDRAHNERLIALDVVPGVADTLGLPSGQVVRRLAEHRLVALLAEAAGLDDAEIRGLVVDELRPVAAATGLEPMLDDFTAGRPLPRPARFRRLAGGASVINAQMRTVADRFVRLGGRR